MSDIFSGSREAEEWFYEELIKREYQSITKKTIKEYVKGGRYAYPKLFTCDNKDVYLLTFLRSRQDMLWDSDRVTEEFRNLDERLKLAIKIFGQGVNQMTQCKELTLLHLLNLNNEGYQTFMVTVYSNGDAFWARAIDFYEFSTRYGTYQEFFRSAELAYGLPYRVPTGWMIPWRKKSLKYAVPMMKG